MSFELLCQASEHICSAAPIGATPLNEMEWLDGTYTPGMPTCWNPAQGGKGPAKKRSVMFQLGTKDILFQGEAGDAFKKGVNAIKQLYGIQGDGTKLNVGAGA